MIPGSGSSASTPRIRSRCGWPGGSSTCPITTRGCSWSSRRRAEPSRTFRGSILYAGVRRRLGPLPASYLIRGDVIGPIEPAQPGTLEHFLAERYLLYSRRGGEAVPGAGPSCALPLAEGRRPLARREPAGRRRNRPSLRSPPRPLRGRSRRRSLPSPPRRLIAGFLQSAGGMSSRATLSDGPRGIRRDMARTLREWGPEWEGDVRPAMAHTGVPCGGLSRCGLIPASARHA